MSFPSFIQRITIKHPGYSGNNTILALPACDGTDSQGKAHYATVHSACAIVANNRKDGWLSSDRSGQSRTCADSEGLIPAGVYFFHIETETELGSDPYPVVPNFCAWMFPHDNMPSFWHKSAPSAAAIEPQEKCRLTGRRLACENAHIIPTAEKSWFADNEMDQYGNLGGRTGQDVADSAANLIRLRRDVHSLWDSLFFSIIPKKLPNHENDGATWYAHSMVQDEELYADYHNRPMESLAGRAVEYLYARFARDIFPKVIGFLQSTQPRRLAVRRSNGEVEVRYFSPQECKCFTQGQGRGRSASPTKRSRGPDGTDYKYGVGGEQCALMTNRKRPRASYGKFSDDDSAISDVESAGEIDNHWDLKGCVSLSDSSYCVSDQPEREPSRGRKRLRET
jgi:hypothetical protein